MCLVRLLWMESRRPECFSANHQCCQQPDGCGVCGRSGSWGAQQVAFLTQAHPSLPHFDTMQPRCPSCDVWSVTGQEQVKWTWWKHSTSYKLRLSPPAILALCGAFQARAVEDQKRPARNSGGWKLCPGQLISSPSHLSSFFLFVGSSVSFPPSLSRSTVRKSLVD